MPKQALYALLAAAVLVFWMVGAYNRLVALRNGIGEAWAKVDEALRARAAAATPLLAALAEPLAAEQGALEAAQAALTEAARSAGQMSGGPVVEAHAAAWSTAEANLKAAASRLFALMEQHSDLRQIELVVSGASAWREADTRLSFARQLFNEAATTYNQAITLFPTRLLLRMFRFGRAGQI